MPNSVVGRLIALVQEVLVVQAPTKSEVHAFLVEHPEFDPIYEALVRRESIDLSAVDELCSSYGIDPIAAVKHLVFLTQGFRVEIILPESEADQGSSTAENAERSGSSSGKRRYQSKKRTAAEEKILELTGQTDLAAACSKLLEQHGSRSAAIAYLQGEGVTVGIPTLFKILRTVLGRGSNKGIGKPKPADDGDPQGDTNNEGEGSNHRGDDARISQLAQKVGAIARHFGNEGEGAEVVVARLLHQHPVPSHFLRTVNAVLAEKELQPLSMWDYSSLVQSPSVRKLAEPEWRKKLSAVAQSKGRTDSDEDVAEMFEEIYMQTGGVYAKMKGLLDRATTMAGVTPVSLQDLEQIRIWFLAKRQPVVLREG